MTWGRMMAEPRPTTDLVVEIYIHEADGKFYPGVKTYINGKFESGYFLGFFYLSADLAVPFARKLMALEMSKFQSRAKYLGLL